MANTKLTLDEVAIKNGGYVDTPATPTIIDADYVGLVKYCKKLGIDPYDASDEIYAMFKFDKELVYV